MRRRAQSAVKQRRNRITRFATPIFHHSLFHPRQALARILTTLRTMVDTVPHDGVPPAREIPSTFMASLRSWSAPTVVKLRHILIIILGGLRVRRKRPVARNAY